LAALDEIEEAVARLAPNADFFPDQEAQEWNETMARRNDRLETLRRNQTDELPTEI